MFYNIILILCVGATTYISAAVSGNERIIGGWEAVQGQFGHQVSIREHHTHFCGGSILDRWTILTAARCLEGRILSDLLVVAGTNSLKYGGQAYDVADKMIHNDYDKVTGANDLAILKLVVPITFTQRMRVATIPQNPPDDSYIQITGWGWYKFPGNYSEELRYLNVPLLQADECAKLLENFIVTEKHICSKPSAGEGTCIGDFGNGMFNYDDELIGLAVWSATPCGTGSPGVYMNIYEYRDWIEAHKSHESIIN